MGREFGQAALQRTIVKHVCRALGSIDETGVHEGKDNKLLTPRDMSKGRKISCHQRLGGLLKFYARAA